MLSLLLTVATMAGAAGAAPPAARSASQPGNPHIEVRVDSAHSQIIVTAGPFNLPAMDPHMDMADMPHMPNEVMRFDWPVHGYLRGFNVVMRDAAGDTLPANILHHLIGVNFDRRQLVYHAVERLFGWGAETSPVVLPSSLGVPLRMGEHLGMYAMFHNETGHDIDAAYLRLTILYTPSKTKHVLEVMPFYVDVNNVIGGATTFDVPPGKSMRSYEFQLPLSGKLVGIGGHLHDYGTMVELQDASTGKVLARLKAKRDDQGHVEGVGRFIFGFNSDALALEAHHPYRVVAEYDNPTHDTIKDGAMAHINGAFVPDDMSQWPKLDLNDPLVKKDLAALPSMTDMTAGSTASRSNSQGASRPSSAQSSSMRSDMPMGPMDGMGRRPSGNPKPDSVPHDEPRR